MALSESAVSDLLEVLRTGDDVDLIGVSVRMVLQELIETEARDVIGTARYECTDSPVNKRNGSRPRILATQAGDIDLRIPKLRKGSSPADSRTAPPHRPGVVHDGDGGPCRWGVHPSCR
jgi:hypothetical protein